MHKYHVYLSNFKTANIILDEEIFEESCNIMKVKANFKLFGFDCAALRYNNIPFGYSKKYLIRKIKKKLFKKYNENQFFDVKERLIYDKF
jgi:hypothetical protein